MRANAAADFGRLYGAPPETIRRNVVAAADAVAGGTHASDEELRDKLLEVADFQARAHGIDPEDPGYRGAIRNVLAVMLLEWGLDRQELRELRKLRAAALVLKLWARTLPTTRATTDTLLTESGLAKQLAELEDYYTRRDGGTL